MSEYGDEGFIYEMVQEGQAPLYEGNDIRNGEAFVGEQSMSFCEKSIIENKLYMTIPKEFEPMPLWMIKKIYTYENRPDIVFSEKEKILKSVNFWVVNTPAANEGTETVLEEILARTNPDFNIVNTILCCTFFNLKSEDFAENIAQVTVGYFELVTAKDNKEISDLMFFFPLDNKFVFGSFKCFNKELPLWEDTAVQMLKTIRIV